MPGRRLDHVAVAARRRGRRTRASGPPASCRATCRPARRRAPADDRHRMEPQVAADRRVLEAGRLQDRRASAARRPRATTCGARTTSRRGSARPRRARRSRGSVQSALPSTPTAPAAPRRGTPHPDARHDPGSGRMSRGEVRPDPRLLRAAPAAERAAAAVAAVDRVPAGRPALPAERGGAAQDRSSFGGMTVGRRDPDLRLDRRDVGVPLRAGHALEAVVARPLLADPRRAPAGTSSS